MPSFAGDGGEEPEIGGIYLVGEDGTVHRIGFVLGNEFSDHVLERRNYLLLASSKLRPAAVGPELLLGELPADVRRHLADLARQRASSGTSRSSRARPTCATLWPTSSITTSSTRSSAFPDSFTCTSSARRRCRSARGWKPAPVTCSKSPPMRFICRCAIRSSPVRSAERGRSPRYDAAPAARTGRTGQDHRDQHLPAIARNDAVVLTAVATRQPVELDVPVYHDIATMLAQGPTVDGVVMCQPPQARFAAARTALEAGKHVVPRKAAGGHAVRGRGADRAR